MLRRLAILNLPITTKEQIISVCQQIAKEKGLASINMRSVAAECDVSVGAIYNYFPSKAELLCATIESIWKDIFHMSKEQFEFTDFIECLTWLFESIQQGGKKYPEFLSRHTMVLASENKVIGQKMMQKYLVHLKGHLNEVLRKDTKIRKNAFNEKLSQALFVDYVFELFIFSVVNSKQDYQGILELVRRYLY